MNRAGWLATVALGFLCGGLSGWAALYPDGFPVQTGAAFQPLESSNPDRPEWLLATARGVARSPKDLADWAVYEVVLDRQVSFHHVLAELVLTDKPTELHVRLLDGNRQVLSADLFGNVADRAEVPGNVFLDIPVATYPDAGVVQLLIPLRDEFKLTQMMWTPASFEILMKTGADFVSGARAWIRTPILNSKSISMLSDLVLLEEGRLGDMSSPVSAFRAYGVEARKLEPAEDSTFHSAGFALDAMPLLARVDVALRNFDPLSPPELWLNGQALGPLSLELPDLEEDAYRSMAQGEWTVGRWTRAWFFIPPEALRMGDNWLELRPKFGDEAELEIRDEGIQFKYPWEEIGTYSFVKAGASTRHEPIAGNTSPAPRNTTGQEQDTIVVRVDHDQFRPIGEGSEKPDWLVSLNCEFPNQELKERQYRIRLNPENRPAQLGIDIVSYRGQGGVTVSLLSGERMVVEDLIQTDLNSGYAQITTQLLVPLQDHPEVDTVLLFIGSWQGGNPSISRLQLKAVWPAATLATGQLGTEGAVADMQFDSRSAFIPAEVVVPDAGPASAIVQHIAPTVEGEWYGAETRVLEEGEVNHGDVWDRYFTDWAVTVDKVPALGRVDLLTMHISVVDGMEVFVNGKRAGAMSLHLPGAQDASYVVFHVNRISGDGQRLTFDEKYAIDYGAYARASLVFDGNLLRPGKNIISIGRTPRLKGTNDHYTFKKVRLQLK